MNVRRARLGFLPTGVRRLGAPIVITPEMLTAITESASTVATTTASIVRDAPPKRRREAAPVALPAPPAPRRKTPKWALPAGVALAAILVIALSRRK